MMNPALQPIPLREVGSRFQTQPVNCKTPYALHIGIVTKAFCCW